MEKNRDVFISHSSTDSNLANAICHYLEQRNLRCWIAPRDVQGGMEYAESIIHGIRTCKVMVVVFNQNANTSLFVKNEVERAFNYKSIIIPFKVDETIPSATLELFLGSVHWLDAVKGRAEDYFELLYQNCARSLGKSPVVLSTANEFSNQTIVESTVIENKPIEIPKTEANLSPSPNNPTHSETPKGLSKNLKIMIIVVIAMILIATITFIIVNDSSNKEEKTEQSSNSKEYKSERSMDDIDNEEYSEPIDDVENYREMESPQEMRIDNNNYPDTSF